MELVTAYNKANKPSNMHLITMESVANDVLNKHIHSFLTKFKRSEIKYELENEMRNRGLDRHFQALLSVDDQGSINCVISIVNKFNLPKECVIWN